MKKIISLISLFCILFIFCGCNSNKTNNEIYNKTYDVSIHIDEFEELVEAAIEKASSGVISVGAYKGTMFTPRLDGTGSGVIYEGIAILNDGTEIDLESSKSHQDVAYYTYYVITNQHVIQGSNIIRVYLGHDTNEINATLVRASSSDDLAILTFSSSLFIKPLEFADSDDVKRGTFVIAIGSPEGYEFHGTASFGIISYANRYVDEDGTKKLYMQTDASINPGNSGGALINLKGEVIGINTMKLVEEEIEGMGFAIPSNIVKQFINQ